MPKKTIPCRHANGEERDWLKPVSDYYPLSVDEVRALLEEAKGLTSAADLSDIQCRLVQGVVGAVCPHETTGEVASRSLMIDWLFVMRYQEGGTDELVNLMVQIMNGNPPEEYKKKFSI